MPLLPRSFTTTRTISRAHSSPWYFICSPSCLMKDVPTKQNTNDTLRAGTGFMLQPSEAIAELTREGYDRNIVARYDHFELDSGRETLFPLDFEVDEILRFENTSDPDDQSILYAISSPSHRLKGLYLESYGVYHEDFSKDMIRRLSQKPH
jgi:hypothetical protein